MFSSEQEHVIKITEAFVEEFMKNYDDSHDFKHVLRVKNTATLIAQSENLTADEIFEVQLGALTHDINDHKYTCDIFSQEALLEEFFSDKLEKEVLENVIRIACNVSLSKEISQEHNNIHTECKKLFCVQDADRIDSLGSIGITRYFAYGMLKTKSSIKDIMKNIEVRTAVLIKHIKTDLGKQIAQEKYKIIKMFLDDYNVM
jgi:uncharacterized protein